MVSVLIWGLAVGAIGLGIVSTSIASEQATTTQAVHFSTLIESLPDAPSEWEGEEPFGMTHTYEGGTWSTAIKSYSKMGAEDVTADITISDYALYTTGWSAAWKGFYAFESTEGYAKSVTINGFPAWEVYSKDTNDYSLYVGINDRFLVFITTNSDKDTLYKFANSIDYNGITASVKGGTPPMVTEMPTGQPTQPPETATPTKLPAEGGKAPGFEVILAVAGLLAVTYLLMRRRK
jgi:PGF-CTERM protein